MKSIFVLWLSLGMAGDIPGPERQHLTLMAFIESNIQLPDGARPIGEYSRGYARLPTGKILGVYVTPLPSLVDQGCEVMLANLESRSCSDAEVAELAQRDLEMVATFGEAGRSRWFDDYRQVPYINGGGCEQVEIIFDPRLKRVERAACNPPY